ncbi:MAG: penicillin-binding transpeptidase domain-containing protein, partial [Treponema sp.]|nr:penicillin-binding transpeptidase domain-containing protein [Treponema sp.]
MNGLVKWRFFTVIGILLVAAVFILFRYGALLLTGASNQARWSQAPVERGKIIDRNGKILASSTTMYNVFVVPPQKDSIRALAVDLAAILEMNEDDVYNRIDRSYENFLLKRQVSASAMEMIKNYQLENRLKGVSTVPVTARRYPEKNLAAQVIGFTGRDENGRGGVEYAFNKELSAGNDIVLTIDINVQHILEKVAVSTLKETQAESVMFLAMDPRNGEILGSAILPGFDPNDYNASDPETYNNHAAISPYEPGSVFKIFSISALMDAGVISEHSEFICNGVYERVFNREVVRIGCADGRAHGRVRPREIIINSCNVGTAYAAERLDNQTFYEYMLKFGFGNKTGAWINSATSDSPLTETAGMLKDPGVPGLWWGRTRQSIAFGQEIAVSALQVLQAATVITNNGVMVPPKVVSEIVSADGRTTHCENGGNTGRQVIRQETAHKMLSFMEDAATAIGTGWRASVEDLDMAVKTGTSQYRDPVAGGYSKTDFVASCIAILPAESPSLILYVIITKPRGETYGGRIAAPAIREASELLIDYLGIPIGRNPIVEYPNTISFTEEHLPSVSTHVPNFYGLSKKTLLPLLLRNDIRVEISGDGWVRRQYPLP